MKRLLAAILSLCLLASPAFAAKEVPSDHFGHLPMLDMVRLSPDGKTISALFNGPSGPQVVVAPFGSADIVPIVQLERDKDRIDSILWQNNDRLLIRASYSRAWRGERVRVSRLFTVTKEGKGLQVVQQKQKLKKSRMDEFAEVMSNSTILSILPDDPDHILMELWSDRDQGYSVFKVNPEENDYEKVLVNDLEVSDWYANRAGVINFGRRFKWLEEEKEYETIFFYRSSNDKPFKKIYSERESSSGYFSIEAIIGDKMYVITDREIGRKALWLYDIPSAKYEKVLYSHEKYDIESAIVSYDEDKVLGVSYIDDYRRNHYFDGAMSSRQQFIDAAFSKFITWNSGESRDGNRVIVAAQRNNLPMHYFWLDVTTKKGAMWYSQYPYLAKVPLANTGAYTFKASDGMELHGYLTMPVNSGDKKPKVVIMPHGGPKARDYQYFDPYVQFLANRGYAVLQVNFRGSEGFGNAYELAGYKQWGKRMQQDVYDAFDWLKAQNIVDDKNACVVGASYGGYVALTAAFQKSELFNCFVSIAGISNLYDMVKSEVLNNRGVRYYVLQTIGDPDDGKVAAEMKALSAINNLDKIKKPVLLIHGTYDTRVRFEQSADFYSSAKAKGLNVKYIELDKGTHFLDEDANRKATFKAIDDFLSEHL